MTLPMRTIGHKWLLSGMIFILLVGAMIYLNRSILLAPAEEPAPFQNITDLVAVQVTRNPIASPMAGCTDHFLAHELDHLTNTTDGIIRAFAANGAGLAVNDLDNDGDLDLVLGAEAGANSILWNQGGLTFTKSTFGEGPTRAVTVIDVDGDRMRDVVLTTNRGALHYWHNEGDRTFARRVLPGVAFPAYAINWADLDRDGDLDLVTASYDAGFLTDIGDEYLLGDSAGVYVYEYIYDKRGETLRPTRLASAAQALALALWDLDNDGRLDILVGNDFAVPDYSWLQTPTGWQRTEPFAVTAYSTMSLDRGDIDNDGLPELLAADMNPYDTTPAVLAQWLPVISRMEQGARLRDDPQTMTNALQVWHNGRWQEDATGHGIQATGWSWTSRFGDLDNDGHLDLYVVNGMIEEGTFGHLPNAELIEENQVYRNDGQGHFLAQPGWGLGSTRSGRSMVMADLDGDGDLDIVVNNLRSPAQLFENQLCGGKSIAVALQWHGVQNHDAIGAQGTLQTSLGPLTRDVRAASGYLSADAPVMHFGLPADATVTGLEIQWPDGRRSIVTDELAGQMLLIVARTEDN